VAEQKFILDGIGSLEAGINSGLLPQLLENNQAAFATNTTFRGGFARPRPPFRRMALKFGGNTTLQQNSTKKLFQRACFYNPDYGPESLVASIAGRLFLFTPDSSNGCTVTDITIPGDPNPTTPTIAYLRQSEKWVIVDDSQSVPIFYDGTISRRSNSIQTVLGVVDAPGFTAPAKGSTVIIPVVAPGFLGQIGDVFFIETSGASYQATYPAATPNATVTNLVDSSVTHVIGDQVIVNPNILGCQATNLTLGASGTFAPNTLLVTLTLTQTYAGANGVIVSFLGKNWTIISHSGAFILIRNNQTITVANDFIPAGTQIPFSGTSFPITVLGTLTAPFVVPGSGSSVDIIMSTPYTGTNGQVVFIGTGQYTISQKPPPAPGTSLTAININDIPGTVIPAGKKLLSVPELPTARMGAYGLGRNWFSLPDARRFGASDIVGGSSGTPANNFRDAVLKMTENLYLAGGGFFTIPSSGDQITTMRFAATLDASLGQGPLQVGTQSYMFSCQAPVDRALWQNITNPILTVSMIGFGPQGHDSTISLNSDIVFRSVSGLGSLILARREFATWGNTPISREIDRVLNLDDISLLPFGSGISFDNRWIETALPTQGPLGVFHQGLVVMNLDPISTLRGKSPSIYDGLFTGVQVLQVVQGSFSDIQRAFAFCYDSFENEIQLWELLPTSDNNLFDNGNTPIQWSFETASLFKNSKGKGPFDLLRLLDGEFYISDLVGPAHYRVHYRAENDPCWHFWFESDICAAPGDPKQFRSRIGLGQPNIKDCDPVNNRPSSVGVNFQFRFEFVGSFRFLGALFKAVPELETTFSVPVCDPICGTIGLDENASCEPCKSVGQCITFPIVSYNLNNQRSYSNPLLSFNIECKGGQTVTVYVQAGTVQFTFPYPAGMEIYPPIVMGCLSGGSIVSNIPPFATQQQIDDIVNSMIIKCAEQYAQSVADCPVVLITNEQVQVAVVCPDGQNIQFTGSLPSWITIDSTNNLVIGAAGVIQGVTVEAATAQAQAQLQAWVDAETLAGNLTCVSPSNVCTDGISSILNNLYAIDGYFDGMIQVHGAPSVNPTWDGAFHLHDPGPPPGWWAGLALTLKVDGKEMCNASLLFNGCVAGVPLWVLRVESNGFIDWNGVKNGGNTPQGVYNRTSGIDASPATVTIVQIAGTSTLAGGIIACGD